MTVAWWSMIPFALLLISIAILPLVPATEHAWEKIPVKLAVALGLSLPIAVWFVAAGESTEIFDALVEYVQFIMLLLALFVVSGGIFLTGDIRATPKNNTVFLGVGALIASFIGTTGAAMLLIRPLLNTNSERAHRVHTVVFTILIVANCGGVLTPLGDPPLFLGFLRGVPFTWTFSLIPEWLFVNALLLATYYGLDRREYAKETEAAIAWDDSNQRPLGIAGKVNFLFFAVIIAAVAFAPSIDLEAIEAGHATAVDVIPWRELIFLAAAVLSYVLGSHEVRFTLNKFTWEPILEVAALFVGIFVTMVPALLYLEQIAPTLPLNEVTFFIFTGGLSSVLDNAPTYATFFSMASQLPGTPLVAGVPEHYLSAISLGAVFCGAFTYIGNGPNFMTKAVADGAGVPMPSFGGYVRWTLSFLLPPITALVLVFLTDGLVWKILGVVLAIGILVRAAILRRHVHPSEVALRG